MSGHKLWAMLVGLLTLTLVCAHCALGADRRCKDLQRQFSEKQRLMNEYLEALQASYSSRDFPLTSALSSKVSELRKELSALKLQLAACPSRQPMSALRSAGPTGSGDPQFENKSCEEAQKLFFSLTRKVTALNKRQGSVLAGITTEEEAQLAEATSHLTELKAILDTRCPPTQDRRSPAKPLRPSGKDIIQK